MPVGTTRRAATAPAPGEGTGSHRPGASRRSEEEAPARPRRRPALAAAGLTVVLVCTLLGGILAMRLGHRTGYLVITRNLPAGAVLTPADLGVVGLSTSGRIDAVAATAAHEVVGTWATEPLSEGTLLAQSDLTLTSPVPASDALVGTSLTPSQVPAGLQAGDQVLVVFTGAAGTSVAGASQGPLADPAAPAASQARSGFAAGDGSAFGRVITPGSAYSVGAGYSAPASSNGGELVTLEVPGASAAAVSAASAAGEISLAEIPPR